MLREFSQTLPEGGFAMTDGCEPPVSQGSLRRSGCDIIRVFLGTTLIVAGIGSLNVVSIAVM